VLDPAFVHLSWMIFIGTCAALAACSSEPPKQLDLGDQGGGGARSTGKETPMPDASDGVLGGGDGAPDPATSAPLDGDASASPPPPPMTPDAGPPAPADPGPIGSLCEAGDTKEILGKDTPFTNAACGALQSSIDEDFYLLDVPTPKTLLLRIGAQADAVARLTTPDGKVLVVSSAASGNVASAAGKAVIRVRSKIGAVQSYRIVVD
jgi:hypothetical protein